MSASRIQLFDANCHPTLGGGWPTKGLDSSFKRLADEMAQNRYRGACAVGIWGLERYRHKAFIEECRKFTGLVPIAGYFPSRSSGISGDLKAIHKMGYRGIKIHPKEPAIRLSDPRLKETFRAASDIGLRIFLCTYLHAPIKAYPDTDPLYDIVSLLKAAPKARVLLVHGGGVELLRYAELARFNPGLLLDLSLTLMKYRFSSIDLDMRFLFERFDERVCIGTDFPEYTHREVADRFAVLSRGIARKKIENIAFGNIQRFLK